MTRVMSKKDVLFNFKNENFIIFFFLTKRTKEFLKNALFENDFMKNLELEQIEKIVSCMYPVEFLKECLIIQEGDIGNILYITQG